MEARREPYVRPLPATSPAAPLLSNALEPTGGPFTDLFAVGLPPCFTCTQVPSPGRLRLLKREMLSRCGRQVEMQTLGPALQAPPALTPAAAVGRCCFLLLGPNALESLMLGSLTA